MNNNFHDLPAIMNDGRMFTDYRSSQVREEIFKNKHCIGNENEARHYRMDNAEILMNDEWSYLKEKNAKYVNKKQFNKHNSTMVSNTYNTEQLLAYNNIIPQPSTQNIDCQDYRLTNQKNICQEYPNHLVQLTNPKSNKFIPENLYHIDDKY